MISSKADLLTNQRESVQHPEERKPSGPLKLCIGGIGLSVQWPESATAGWPHPFYEPFVSDGDETIRVNVRFGDCPDFSSGQLIFDAGENWRLYRQDSRYIFEIFDTLTGARNTVAVVDDGFREAEAYVSPVSSKNSAVPWSLPRLMQPLGQLLLINLLARLGGVMVHALGIDDRGGGTVYVGPSGSGKTTLGGFWRRHEAVRILSDEHVILRLQGERLYVYGTPWSGLLLAVAPHPGPVEVHRMFFIGHDREHRIWNEPKGTFASHLFSQLFLPFWNRKALTSALEFCQQLVLTTPCQRLGFAKEPSIIDFLRNPEAGGTR